MDMNEKRAKHVRHYKHPSLLLLLEIEVNNNNNMLKWKIAQKWDLLDGIMF